MLAVQRRACIEDRAGTGAHSDCRDRRFRNGPQGPSLHALEERIAIELDGEVEAASNELSTGARVTVTLYDGRTLSKFVPAPKGSPSQPFTGEEHEARFKQELASRVSERSAPNRGDVAQSRSTRSTLARARIGEERPSSGCRSVGSSMAKKWTHTEAFLYFGCVYRKRHPH